MVVISIGATPNDSVWDSDVDGNSVAVGAQRSLEVQQVGQLGGGEGQNQTGTGTEVPDGPIIEEAWVMDCPGASPGTADGMCETAYECPENAGLAIPEYFRMRQYRREIDRETGAPLTQWQHVGTSCITIQERLALETEQASGPSLLALVTQEWQRVQIPAATVHINPPDGRTIVNFDTVFYTDAGEQEFPVTVLGQPVIIYAIPVEYTWHHGDGTTQTTTRPGAPYPSKDVTHQYASTGTVAPRVDVRYRAEFSVAGGERQAVPGFATVTGTSEELSVLEARTQLVDGR